MVPPPTMNPNRTAPDTSSVFLERKGDEEFIGTIYASALGSQPITLRRLTGSPMAYSTISGVSFRTDAVRKIGADGSETPLEIYVVREADEVLPEVDTHLFIGGTDTGITVSFKVRPGMEFAATAISANDLLFSGSTLNAFTSSSSPAIIYRPVGGLPEGGLPIAKFTVSNFQGAVRFHIKEEDLETGDAKHDCTDYGTASGANGEVITIKIVEDVASTAVRSLTIKVKDGGDFNESIKVYFMFVRPTDLEGLGGSGNAGVQVIPFARSLNNNLAYSNEDTPYVYIPQKNASVAVAYLDLFDVSGVEVSVESPDGLSLSTSSNTSDGVTRTTISSAANPTPGFYEDVEVQVSYNGSSFSLYFTVVVVGGPTVGDVQTHPLLKLSGSEYSSFARLNTNDSLQFVQATQQVTFAPRTMAMCDATSVADMAALWFAVGDSGFANSIVEVSNNDATGVVVELQFKATTVARGMNTTGTRKLYADGAWGVQIADNTSNRLWSWTSRVGSNLVAQRATSDSNATLVPVTADGIANQNAGSGNTDLDLRSGDVGRITAMSAIQWSVADVSNYLDNVGVAVQVFSSAKSIAARDELSWSNSGTDVEYSNSDASHPALRLVSGSNKYVARRKTAALFGIMELELDTDRTVSDRTGTYTLRFEALSLNFQMSGEEGEDGFDGETRFLDVPVVITWDSVSGCLALDTLSTSMFGFLRAGAFTGSTLNDDIDLDGRLQCRWSDDCGDHDERVAQFTHSVGSPVNLETIQLALFPKYTSGVTAANAADLLTVPTFPLFSGSSETLSGMGMGSMGMFLNDTRPMRWVLLVQRAGASDEYAAIASDETRTLDGYTMRDAARFSTYASDNNFESMEYGMRWTPVRIGVRSWCCVAGNQDVDFWRCNQTRFNSSAFNALGAYKYDDEAAFEQLTDRIGFLPTAGVTTVFWHGAA